MVQLFLEQLLNGLQLGVLLFLMAAGLTLIFGIMNFVNLAHGSLFMIGAYLSVTFQQLTGSYELGILLGVLGSFVLGVVLDLTIFRWLYQRDHLDQVLCTVGMLIFFNEAARMIWGSAPIFSGIPAYLSGSVEIFEGVPYPVYRVFIIAVGLAVALGLYLLVNHTRVGMLIRAGASNRAMLGALGVNVRVVFTGIVGIGAAMAGLAGMMAGPILTVAPGMGDNIVILALVILIIGGMGSVKGAFFGALIVGLVDTIGRAYLRDVMQLVLGPGAADAVAPALASMLIYLLMAVILFFRPQGLFPPAGAGTVHAAAAPMHSDRNSWSIGLLKRWRNPFVIACVVAAALVPWLASVFNEPFWLDMATRFVIFAIAAVSLDLILGYGGMVSFGHAMFLGLGAYAVGVLSYHSVDSGLVQFTTAAALSAGAAVVIGAVSLRTSGVHFIMITLAFAQMLYFVGQSLYEYGGDDGFPLYARSEFGGLIDLYDGATFYFFCLAALLGSILLCSVIMKSRFGMVVRGAKSNERRMRAIGFQTFWHRLTAFVLSAAICGIAGGLLANLTQFVSPAYMEWVRSGEIMLMVIMGGLSSFFGPAIGAFGFLGLETVLADLTTHWPVFFGPILIAIVLFAKRGVFGLFASR